MNKEKQIFDKHGNYDFPTEIKQEGLNVATSKIEEMAKDIPFLTLDREVYVSANEKAKRGLR